MNQYNAKNFIASTSQAFGMHAGPTNRPEGQPVRVMVADDHQIVLIGVTSLFAADSRLEVVAQVNSVAGLLDALEAHPCDVLICDYAFDGDPDQDGLGLLSRIRRKHPDVRIIVMTAHDDLSMVRRVLMLGVAGFFSKASNDFSLLPNAVLDVARGDNYFDPKTLQALVRHTFNNNSQSVPLLTAKLTPREIEVARLFATGMAVTQIAATMHRSLKTISTQKKSAMVKLGAKNDIEFVEAFKMNF